MAWMCPCELNCSQNTFLKTPVAQPEGNEGPEGQMAPDSNPVGLLRDTKIQKYRTKLCCH